MAWACPTARTDGPGMAGSSAEGEGEGARTRAEGKERVGKERGREMEVKGRSFPPVGWVGLKGSRSSS